MTAPPATAPDPAASDTPAPPARNAAVLVLSALMVAGALAWGLGLPQRAGVTLFEEQIMAAVLGVAMALVAGTLAAGRPRAVQALAWGLGALMLGLMLLLAWRYPQLMILSVLRPAWLVATCAAVLAGLALLVCRTVGLAVVLIVVAFSALAVGGWFGVPATPPARWAVYMVTDPNAMIGLPLRVAVQIVIPFILLGALLQHSGGSAFFTGLCVAAFGRFRGGQAKAAVGASALFGTVSGNAVSNVAGTGIVTIPLMKRAGLAPHVAAAVESAASTGGQLLPPVMGAAAFVMADTLQVPYLTVVSAALLPALLYYAAIFVQIDRYAARRGLAPAAPGSGPSAAAMLRQGWHFLLPFAVLFVLLFRYQTRPDFAALGAIGALAVAAALRPWQGRRLGVGTILAAVEETGRSAAPLILVTAAAGLVIGLVSLTGLGFSIAMQAVAAAGGNTVLLLLMVAAIAVVFGMGMPTVAVYVVLATVLAPALIEAGLLPIQAHLFILYFGLLSMLTPPVALASITAARIAGTDLWRTSFAAMRLAWVAYFIPFLFAFSPELLLIGSPWGAGLAALTAFAGTSAVSIAAVGYARAPIGPLWRLGFAAVGVALLLPPSWGQAEALANAAGALALVALYVASGRMTRPAAGLS